MKKETIVKKQPKKKVLAKAGVPHINADMADMFAEDAGLGLESMTKDDFAIPRIGILQTTSPQVNKRDGEYIDGAEPSMFLENVGNSLFDGEKGITVIPIKYRRTVIEWRLRDTVGGGGFVADHGLDGDLLKNATRDDKGRFINADGNQLVETCEYYVFLVTTEGWQAAVISMASTQMRKSKRWNVLIDSVKIKRPDGRRVPAAMFYMSYTLTTVPESNDKGSWFGWSIVKNGATVELDEGAEIYLAARDFHKQVSAGEVKVATPLGGGNGEIQTESSPM